MLAALLALVARQVATMRRDQDALRRDVVQQRETLNRIVSRLNRMPTQQDMELGLIALQGNITLILAGRPPAPISITQRNSSPGADDGGAIFTGLNTVHGPAIGGNVSRMEPPGKSERPHTL